MDSMELCELMQRAADFAIANGETPEQIEARATEQEREGFTISATYTRLLASTVRAALIGGQS